MLRTIKFLTSLLLLLCLQKVHGQDPYYIRIDVTKGLPSNKIFDVYHDTKGFIWLAHNEGLSRYDGFECITYTSPEQTSKAGGCITEDSFGRIWYENFDGYLYYVQNDTLRHLASQRTPTGYVNFAILNSKIITIHYNYIDFYDITTLQRVKSIEVGPSYISNAIVSNNKYYVSSMYIYTVANNTIEDSVSIAPFKFGGGTLGFLCASPDGYIIFSRDNEQKIALQDKNGKFIKKFDLPDIKFIHQIRYTGDYYWVCSPVGVYGFAPDGKMLNNGHPYFAGKNILGVHKDREGNYWFQSASEGVLLVPDLNVSLWKLGELIPKDISVLNNIAWISTQSGDILNMGLRQPKYTNVYKNTSGHDIISFCIDTARKNIFFTANDFKQIDYAGRVISQFVPSVKKIKKIDDKYYAYAASGSLGLFVVKNSSTKPNRWDSLHNCHIDNSVWPNSSQFFGGVRAKDVAYSASRQAIYFATNRGLFKATPTKVAEMKQNNKSIFLLQLQEYENTIFALNAEGRLYTIENEDVLKDFIIGENGKFVVDKIKILNNYLFLFSGKDIYYVNLLSHRHPPVKIENIIANTEINDIAFWENRLIFSINDGLIMVDFPVTKAIKPTGFQVNKFFINGVAHNADSFVSVSYQKNDIEIYYSVLAFNPRHRVPVYYRINNTGWQSLPAGSNSLKLASLSPGGYKIQFRLGNTPPIKTIHFVIKKPLWWQWWFWTVVVLLLLAGAFVYYRWRLNTQKRENNLVIEKIELEKNLRHSMLASIKSQMNPHFFYNALNTIQSYIFSDDKRNASGYLSKFSKLTRMILEMSERETVSLTEEVNALMLYLELEKARFNEDDFNFSIEVDSSIDMDMLSIPSMIVQPYVENAIKHGLLHKKGKKHLKVDFYRENDNLHIVVDDNGIGRKKSAELAKIKNDKHNSFATRANFTRIEILNKGNNKIGVEYEDKTDFSGNVMGTRVSITIPVKGTIYDEHYYQSHNN